MKSGPVHANKVAREKHLMDVANRYLRGETQVEIAVETGVTQQQISYDLKVLRGRWLRSSIRDFDEARAQELAKIDDLEREYWGAWDASKDKFEATTTEQSNGKMAQTKAKIHRETRTGDLRYLLGVQWCIERRCKLLGLDAPTKQEISGRGGGPIAFLPIVTTDDVETP